MILPIGQLAVSAHRVGGLVHQQTRTSRSWRSFALTAVVVSASCSRPAEEVLEPWPFKPTRLNLSCEAGRVFVTTPEGRRYAANGSARAIAPITDEIQSHYDTSHVIQRGLALCEAKSDPITIKAPAAAGPTGIGAPAPKATLKPAEIAPEGTFLTIEADTVIDGRRPELTLICEPSKKLDVQFELVQVPETAAPLRGLFGTFRVDQQPEQRIELAWLSEDDWTARTPHPAQTDTARTDIVNQGILLQLLRSFVGGGKLHLSASDRYFQSVTWSKSTFGEHLAAAERCVGED
jgi:hypothetical protein